MEATQISAAIAQAAIDGNLLGGKFVKKFLVTIRGLPVLRKLKGRQLPMPGILFMKNCATQDLKHKHCQSKECSMP
jgi:hypothetical protein